MTKSAGGAVFAGLLAVSCNGLACTSIFKQSDDPSLRESNRFSRSLFEAAVVEAKRIQDGSAKDYALDEITEAQAHAGYFADALQTAQLVTSYQDQLFPKIAVAQAQAGDFVGAKETLGNYVSKRWWKETLGKIAVMEFLKGDEAGAKSDVQQLDVEAQEQLLCEIGVHQVEAGKVTAARKTCDQIQLPYMKAQLLWEIAHAQAKTGDVQGARVTAGRIEDEEIAASIPGMFVDARLEAGDINEALRLARSLRGTERASKLLRIGEAQVRAGNKAAASETLKETTTAGLREQDLFWKATVLGKIAAVELEGGLNATAINDLESLHDVGRTRAAWCEVATAEARYGDLTTALKFAKRMGDDPACALRGISMQQVLRGDIEGAMKTIHVAPNLADVSAGTAELAQELAKRGDFASAKKLADKVKVTGADYEQGYLAPVLRAIARAQAKTGDISGALEWAKGLETPYARASSLLGVAEGIGTYPRKSN